MSPLGNLFSGISAFINKYLILGLAAIVVVISLYAGIQTWRLSSAQTDLAAAQTTISTLRAEVKAKELVITLKDGVVKRLEDRTKELVLERQDYISERKGIENAPAEEDGDVADVLCRAVSGTKCLRDNAAGN